MFHQFKYFLFNKSVLLEIGKNIKNESETNKIPNQSGGHLLQSCRGC